MREQGVVLEDRVDIALVRRQVVDPVALDPQLTGRERDEAADQVEGRRLAATRWTEQTEELARLDLQRYAVDRHGRTVALGDIDELDRGG